MFRSLRSRLILSFGAIVLITLASAGIALFARLGGYRDQLATSTLRQVAQPIYYNLTLSSPATVAQGQRLRRELTAYLEAQQKDSNVTVLLINQDGGVIPESTTDADLLDEHFDVVAPAARGPNFKELPQQRHTTSDGRTLLYVTVPMPASVRAQPAGISEIIVATPATRPGDVFRDLMPRLIFAGGIALAAALVVGLVLWASLYRPLGRVTTGIRAVARGRYRERVPESGPTEVRELAADVNAMADAVEGSQQTLRAFLANVSHELKTPLTSIRGFAQALSDGTLTTPEERDRAARVIDAESRRVLHLVEELLDLSRIESGQQRMDLAPVALSELLKQVEDVFAMRAQESGVTLAVVPPAPDAVVRADFDRIDQVLGNLVDNAFRHTPRGGRIEVSAARARHGMAEVRVADNGAGIAPGDLPHVFDRFYRGSGEASNGGSGLGLAISREIVRAHGGEIRAERAPDGGAIFTFSLALAPAAATVPDAGATVAPAAPLARGQDPGVSGGR